VKSDIPTTRLLQIKLEDWVAYICPELTEINLTDLPAALVPGIKAESRMDCVKWLSDTCIVHFEPMGYFDVALPTRMLRYRSDLWEYTIQKGLGFPKIIQLVILFYKGHDNQVHALHDHFRGEPVLDYHYKVVKVWEMEAEEILKRGLVGLYPLLPLANWGDGVAAEKIIETTVTTITALKDVALGIELLAAMGVLAEGTFPRNLIRKYVRKEQLMASELLMELYGDLLKEQVEEQVAEQVSEVTKQVRKQAAEQVAEVEDQVGKQVAEKEETLIVNMLREGIAPEVAVKITGLPFEKIRELTLKLAN
jgi:hypothetical protein